MRKIKNIIVVLFVMSLLIIGCNKVGEDNMNNNKGNFNSEEKNDEVKENDIREKIESMSLDEKLGQLIIVGFEGTDINDNISSFIKDLKVGGVIHFKRNIESVEQVIELNNNIKELNKDSDIPLFVSIDEEGGDVSRLSQEYKDLPTANRLGQLDNEDVSFEYGELLGLRLKSLGFNLNYAPVMDINSNINNPVIGDRAFGNNPELVSKHGLQVMKGIESKNIISSIKHFPGHGDTGVDSHVGLPEMNKSLEEIREFEFVPFKNAIEDDLDMVMVGHILFSEIDNEYPSTMSKKIITNILRDELGFTGVVITDDLTMGAITKNYTLEEATLKFLQAL